MIAGTIMQNQNMETMLKTLLHGYSWSLAPQPKPSYFFTLNKDTFLNIELHLKNNIFS